MRAAKQSKQPKQQPTVDTLEPVKEPHEPQEMHDLRAAIGRMGQALDDEHGVHLDIGLLNTTAQANAACQMLVELGLCTPEQMDTLILRRVRDQLAQILQAVEQARLRQQEATRGVQVVERPKLLVAKH